MDQIKEFARELAGVQPEVEQIRTRNDRYTSFLVQVDKSVKERVLDQDEWEEGLIMLPFRGFLRHDACNPVVTPGACGVTSAPRNGVPTTEGDAETNTKERRDSSDDVISAVGE